MGWLGVGDMNLLFVKGIVTRCLRLSLDLIWNIAVVVVVLVSLFYLSRPIFVRFQSRQVGAVMIHC